MCQEWLSKPPSAAALLVQVLGCDNLLVLMRGDMHLQLSSVRLLPAAPHHERLALCDAEGLPLQMTASLIKVPCPHTELRYP